ncbi:MAG: hypothetical protein IJR72_00225 [Oscillospiraceae bacterium]|nr:hypothetical protein [Oscillospiraceae bacterium]
MSRGQRIIAAAFCILCLFGLSRAAASQQEELYFVAVENMVLPLSGETMPFWDDGYLYISGDIFTGNVRDTTGISRAKIQNSMLIYRGDKCLLFQKDVPYAKDPEERTYSPGLIYRGDNFFVPAYVVANYFDMLYSTTDVEHGKLVWLRSDSFVMTERAFAKAATFQLNTAYQEYVAALEPEPVTIPEPEPAPVAPEEPDSAPSVPDTSSVSKPATSSTTPDKPVTSSTAKPEPPQPVTTPEPEPVTTPEPEPVTTPEPEPPPEPKTVYLCLRGDGVTASLLDVLDRYGLRATVFCDEAFLSGNGDLLRRMTATGYRVGLYVPSGAPESVLECLEACNSLLRHTTMEKTRLVCVDGAGEELSRAVRNAGFLCLRPALDRTETPLRTSRQAAQLLDAVSQQPETFSLWLGGTVSRSGLNTFLSDALEIGHTFQPWTEVTPS